MARRRRLIDGIADGDHLPCAALLRFVREVELVGAEARAAAAARVLAAARGAASAVDIWASTPATRAEIGSTAARLLPGAEAV